MKSMINLIYEYNHWFMASEGSGDRVYAKNYEIAVLI